MKHWMYNNLSLNRCFCCKAISKGENPAWPSVDNGHENGWAMELVEKSKLNVSSWNLRDIPGAPSFRKLKEQAVSSSSSSRYQSETFPSRSSAARSWTYQAWKLKRSIFCTCKISVTCNYFWSFVISICRDVGLTIFFFSRLVKASKASFSKK